MLFFMPYIGPVPACQNAIHAARWYFLDIMIRWNSTAGQPCACYRAAENGLFSRQKPPQRCKIVYLGSSLWLSCAVRQSILAGSFDCFTTKKCCFGGSSWLFSIAGRHFPARRKRKWASESWFPGMTRLIFLQKNRVKKVSCTPVFALMLILFWHPAHAAGVYSIMPAKLLNNFSNMSISEHFFAKEKILL